MRTDYSAQLTSVEDEFERERASLLEVNLKEIEDLFKLHKETEKEFSERKMRQQQENAQKLEELRSRDANEQVDQKIQLEKEMQTLEKCMEDMKAIFKLNDQKLKFNHDVLKEREKVNDLTAKALRKKKTESMSLVRAIKKRFTEKQRGHQQNNINLTKKYKTFTKNFKELQAKYERFEEADERRIREIWSMNEKEAQELVEKIMHCDEVVHLQQLSIPWKRPTDPIFHFLNDPNVTEGADQQEGGASQAQNTSLMDSEHKQDQSRSDLQDDDKSVATAREAGDVKEKYDKIKNVFKLLIDEAPYLIDDKAFDKCEGKSLKEQFAIQIDSIRKALGIDQMEIVELLVDSFYQYEERAEKERLDKEREELEKISDLAEEDMAEMLAQSKMLGKTNTNNDVTGSHRGEGEEEEAVDPTFLNLEPENVVHALQQFDELRKQKAEAAALDGTTRKKAKTMETEEQRKATEKIKQKLYWEKLTNILDPMKLSVWKALDKALAKYYSMLVNRQNLIEETGLLNQQNEELKTLLNQYLQAGVNQELQVPPTQVIRLDQ